MASLKKLLSVVLALSMLLSVTAAFAEATTEGDATPLVVGYSPFSQKFSPFYADTAYDQDVVSAVSVSLMINDRTGGVIYNGIEGETVAYNGTDYTYKGIADLTVDFDEAANVTTYTAKLRNDVKFSDGEPLTADDVIFSYYVVLDPAYVGSNTLNSMDIIGLKDYRTQTTSDVYTKYETIGQAIQAAGADYTATDADPFTQEQYDAYQAIAAQAKTEWEAACQGIVDFVVAGYAADYAESMGLTADEITANPGLQVAFGMAMWGFGGIADGVFTSSTGKTFTLADAQPTIEDYYDATYAKYAGDSTAFLGTELDGVGTYTITDPLGAFISAQAATDEAMAGGIPNISGIKKVDDYTVTVQTNGFDATAIYQIFGITVAPMHYYGDAAQYNYDNNQFGHPYGDLSIVEAKTTAPLGAGPYKFVKYENKVVYFEANENYWKGAPKTKYMQWKESADADKISGVNAGTIDITDPSLSAAAVDEIKTYNSNGELDGDKIVVNTVDNLGYGYIGMNADTVRVGDDSASQESKYLRTGLATVLAVYRDVVIDSYYGDRASVINYPISNTSWAAPQKTDEDYKVAFSTAIDGSELYTADMTAEDKYAAALKACVDYLKAAGYTWDDATSKFTAAPEGALMEYEVIIPADGTGDHPSFGILTDAKAALETIGITLTINDPADSNVLWDKLDAGTQNLWCAAWGATIDPDMYQVYHSSNIVGLGGSDSNHYHLADSDLDQLIMDARTSADQAYRKSVYKACLDKIIEWAVEIPVYQRQNCIIFSPERVNMDTVTPDITTFWGWLNDIELLEMK